MVSTTNRIPLYILVRFCDTFFVQKWISPFIYWVKKFLKDYEPPVIFLLVKGSYQEKEFVCVLAKSAADTPNISVFPHYSVQAAEAHPLSGLYTTIWGFWSESKVWLTEME